MALTLDNLDISAVKFTNEASDFFLNRDIDNCISCLMINYFLNPSNPLYKFVASTLETIRNSKPKIFHTHHWPNSLMISTESHGDIDIMPLVNGLISNLNCTLINE